MAYQAGMYIHTIPNRNSPPAILLRESFRENGKTKNRTIANISNWPPDKIDALGRLLKGEKLVGVDDLFENVASFQQGHVTAVLTAIRRLGLDQVISSKRCKERDRVLAMIAAQILDPQSKLAYTRWWGTTTLPEELDVQDADEEDLYEALDWLVKRQDKIEKKLAARHLTEESLVLYDLTSSYFEGKTCPLAKLGHNRDGKKGKLQVNYGLLADGRGCPMAVSVFEGNTADPKALTSEAQKLKQRFGLNSLVVVGDRGMVGQKQIEEVLRPEGLDWITALKTGAIRALVVKGRIQLGLFDERNLFVFEHPDYPGERLVACRNRELGKLRAHKRESLMEATKAELEKVRGMVGKGRLKTAAAIGVRVGKVVNKYKVAKHFVLEIRDDGFDYRVNEERVSEEAALDGIYVVRTSLSEARMSADDTVRNYKALGQVERAFRSLKTLDLHVRPIRHRLPERVRAHILLCMLAYYVTWHMTEALRPVLFADEDQEAKKSRDPVAPAKRSPGALAKVENRELDNGDEVHSFRTLLKNLSGLVKNVCRRKGAEDNVTTTIVTTPTPAQTRVFQLLDAIRP